MRKEDKSKDMKIGNSRSLQGTTVVKQTCDALYFNNWKVTPVQTSAIFLREYLVGCHFRQGATEPKTQKAMNGFQCYIPTVIVLQIATRDIYGQESIVKAGKIHPKLFLLNGASPSLYDQNPGSA